MKVMIDGNLAMANQFENEPDLLDYKGITIIAPDRDFEYWRERCLLAEDIIRETPCDPDINSSQIEAWNKYNEFLKKHQ